MYIISSSFSFTANSMLGQGNLKAEGTYSLPKFDQTKIFTFKHKRMRPKNSSKRDIKI